MDRHLTLWRRPRIIWEPGTVRSAGLFQVCWNFRRGFGLGVEVINTQDDEDRWPWMLFVHLIFLKVFLHLPGPLRPIVDRQGWQRHGEWANWGFRLNEDIVFSWGYDRTARFRWPWALVFARHEVRLPGGAWVVAESTDQKRSWELRQAIIDQAEHWTLPYRYELRSGEVQERMATIHVEHRYWRRLWLSWLPAFEMCRTTIDVTFSEEVGEESGSYKGGTVGCSYEMRPGETAEQALRRMEAERKF